MSKEIILSDQAAYVSEVEDLGGGVIMVHWECGGPADRDSHDFGWPGRVISANNDGHIGHGWVMLSGASLAVGDCVPVIPLEERL